MKPWSGLLPLPFEEAVAIACREAVDSAAAIVEFCETNHVDHIVIGAAPGFDAAHAARQRLGQGCGRGRLQRHRGAPAAAGVKAIAGWREAGRDAEQSRVKTVKMRSKSRGSLTA
jgi:hypothetical protein